MLHTQADLAPRYFVVLPLNEKILNKVKQLFLE